MMDALHQHLLQAHERMDRTALIEGYITAADVQSDVDAACFFLTHAYVFALEAGDNRADLLRERLAGHGRI